jgi:hypothetical protein
MADTLESTLVPAVHGQVVVNPDGTNVGGSVSLAKDDLPISGASQAVGVAIVDGSGNQITSFGGGTQYTEGDTDATIVGTAIMFETNTGTNAIGVVNASNPLPVSATIDTTGLATTTTDTNTTTIAGAVSGGEMQVSITSEGALSVETTQQSVLGEVSDINSNTSSIDTKTPALGQALAAASVPVVLTAAQITTLTPPAAITGFGTSANQTTIIGHVDGLEGLLTTIDADTGNIATEVAALLTDTELRATPVPVSGTVAVTGVSTLAEQQSQTTHLATIAGDTTDIETAVELIDDTVATLGTTTYTEAATKGLIIGAVRRDADTTLVDTTNEVGPVQMNAAGQLKVEVFSGETLPVTLTSTTVTGTVAVTQSGTWDEVGINDSGNSITVDYATTGSGTATGALRVELPTNGTGVIATVGAVTAITNALPAGTNAIGKLAANSGVDIGDVDVTSIGAGTNAIGNVGLIGRTSGGLTIFRSIDIDESEEEVKATAGQLFSITAFNTTTAPLYLKFYNLTAANTTVGSSTPVLTFLVPANADSDGAGFVWNNDIGFAFSTAISVACTTGVADADTGAPGVNACIINLGYM